MADGGITLSDMEFISYRIIDSEIKTLSSVGMLLLDASSNPPEDWRMGIGFGTVSCIPQDAIFIVPLSLSMELIHIESILEKTDEPYLSVKATIAGLFRFINNTQLDEEIKERLIRRQAPAILFPYLRAAVSNLILNTGFGCKPIPLVNINAMAVSNNAPFEVLTSMNKID